MHCQDQIERASGDTEGSRPPPVVADVPVESAQPMMGFPTTYDVTKLEELHSVSDVFLVAFLTSEWKIPIRWTY